jgi:hypothetical protein
MTSPNKYINLQSNEPAALARIEGLLTGLEGNSELPYPDTSTPPQITIGIGTNLTSQANLAIVLQQMTFTVSVGGQTQTLNVFQAAALQAANDSTEAPSLQSIHLRSVYWRPAKYCRAQLRSAELL